jgi:phosphomannomutase/phosphoglucomutase
MTALELNKRIFRAYDIRGVAERDLGDETVDAIANAYASMILETGARTIAIGRDARPSSPRIFSGLSSVLANAGLTVLDLGQISSPMLYFGVIHGALDGGIMVTASHNPGPDNGMKLLIGPDAMSGEDIQDLYRRAQAGVRVSAEGGTVIAQPIEDRYVDYLVENAQMGPRHLKVAIDGGNGMSGPGLIKVLDRLGVEHTDLYCAPDGTFPNHHPDPTQLDTLTDLQALVVKERCDLGMAFDGDGDRIGVVDEEARVIHGDRVLMIYARELLRVEPGARIVGEVKCSQVLYDMIEEWGGEPIMSRVGHSFIKKTLKERDALLAGEMSGHMFFRHRYLGFDDATYAAVRLLEIVSNLPEDLPMSSLLADVPHPVSTPEIRWECSDDYKFDLVNSVAEYFASRRSVVDIDGARILFPGGWGLVRASNTQPALIMRFEAQTIEQLRAYEDEVRSVVEEEMARRSRR